jgi:hypothetical protein
MRNGELLREGSKREKMTRDAGKKQAARGIWNARGGLRRLFLI